MDFAPIEVISAENYSEVPLQAASPLAVPETEPSLKPDPSASKSAIRRSLRASTLDGVFATVFSNVAGGVLLSNFLVELEASPLEIGMLSSIPMLVNLIQPLGAYLGDRTTSRHWYCLWVFGPSRLLWLLLVLGIGFASWGYITPHNLVILTLGIVLISNVLGALGSASWVSWLAVLVPRRLRGRYFGIRNSASSLTSLLSVPLLGLVVSKYPGGTFQGYGILLLLGLIAGLVSLAFQHFMVDVNPQIQRTTPTKAERKLLNGSGSMAAVQQTQVQQTQTDGDTEKPESAEALHPQSALPQSALKDSSWFKDTNFLMFLLYFGLWMFSVNLSAPFFNLYLLDTLNLDVSLVTLYTSLGAGANLLMLVLWGKVADRLGNRPILLSIGILVAVTPVLWLLTGTDRLSVWLWLPFLHILAGATWAAIDLCSNNIQMGIAPMRQQSTYFAIAAAVAGASGALGTTAGSLLAEVTQFGGLLGLFALSGILRLVALLPLTLVREQRRQSFKQIMQVLFPAKNSLDQEKLEGS